MGTKNFNSATDLITFTRASGGTALRKISYGSELVTNGTFDTDISGWSTSHGTSSSEFDNGTIKLGHTAYNGWARQVVSGLVVGNTYQVKFSVTNDTQGGGGARMVGMYLNNSDYSYIERFFYTRGAVRSYAFNFTATATTSQLRLYKGSNTGATNFDNVSVKEVFFDQADGTLQLFNHGNNVPRIEYDTTGAVKGLLIEEARTNYYPTSTDTYTAYGNGSHVKTVDSSVVNPTGAYGSDKITHTNNFDYCYVGYHGSYATVGTKETYSVYLKNAGHNHVRLRMSNMGGHVNYDFDLSNGNSSLPDIAINSGATGHIEDVGNGWWRCSVTYTATTVNPYPSIFLMPSADTFDIARFQGDGTSGVYMWGHQIETGAFPTSYIPTTGSTATRAKDVAFIPVSDFGYNHKAGTVLVEFKSNKPLSEQFGAFVLHDGTPNNRIMHMTVPNHRGYVRTDSGTQADIAGGNRGATSELVKFALAFAEDDFAATSNGSSPAPDISGTVPSGITRLALGNWYQSYLGSYLNGHIKSIKYYPRRLTNTQLQELTT